MTKIGGSHTGRIWPVGEGAGWKRCLFPPRSDNQRKDFARKDQHAKSRILRERDNKPLRDTPLRATDLCTTSIDSSLGHGLSAEVFSQVLVQVAGKRA